MYVHVLLLKSCFLLKVIFRNATFLFKHRQAPFGGTFVEYVLGVVKPGRLYQASPRHQAAFKSPMQILGRGFLVIICYGGWFGGGKKSVTLLSVKSRRTPFVDS